MPKLKSISGSAVGVKNRRANRLCQDVTLTRVRNTEGYALAVLCDGAGSAKYSREGAEICTDVVASNIGMNYRSYASMRTSDIVVQIFEAVQQQLVNKAVLEGREKGDYACTLLLTLLINERAIFLQLGDGRIAIKEKRNAGWKSVFEPTKGEFHNETDFVTSKIAAERIQYKEIDAHQFSACILMSDGAEEGLYNRTNGVFSVALDGIQAWMVEKNSRLKVKKALHRFLTDVLRQKTFDDVSVAVLVDT